MNTAHRPSHGHHRDPALLRRHTDGVMTLPITDRATTVWFWLGTHEAHRLARPGFPRSSRTAGAASKRRITRGE